jgi:alkanesulfonate monooxygenase SsuD/methylene tetrahydromethanopterin reductase-like flavin-dependent oxidoreductase (luciferase family)
MCCRRAASRSALASVGCPEEIALLGGPPFAQRAQASEECIQAFRELWTAEKPVQQGPYAALDKLPFAPKSAQLPHAPIWVGGEVEGARGRAGRLGNGGSPSLPILAFPSTLRSFMVTRLRKCVPRRKGPVAILVRLWAQFSPFTAVSEPSNKVAKADSRKCPSDR